MSSMAMLNDVGSRISDCPIDENAQYEALIAERDRTGQEILDATKTHAQDTAAHTLSDLGTGALWKVGSGLLWLAPTP